VKSFGRDRLTVSNGKTGKCHFVAVWYQIGAVQWEWWVVGGCTAVYTHPRLIGTPPRFVSNYLYFWYQFKVTSHQPWDPRRK
jgi:hypothetical protein